MDAHHKSLVFFRPCLPPAVAKPMFCVYWFAYFAAGFSEYEVTFACIFTGFAESRLWECRVFSFKNARASQMSRVFPFTFHLFLLLLEALQGFERLWEVLEVFGMVWKVLEGFAGFGGFCEAMVSFDRRGEALGGFGRFCWLWMALSSFWGLWLWKALGSF